MSRENQYQGIILKKQAYGEADEIITLYTREAGKIRGLAKSVKLATSKLQPSLQLLFVVDITLTRSSGLPKIIRVQPLEVLARLREQYDFVTASFVATELVMKSTADEQKNEPLYDSLRNFLGLLNGERVLPVAAQVALAKFKIDLAEASGMAVHRPGAVEAGQAIKFSSSGGGFYVGADTADSRIVSRNVLEDFIRLQQCTYTDVRNSETDPSELQGLLSAFLSYQLEREIKSERFLRRSSADVV